MELSGGSSHILARRAAPHAPCIVRVPSFIARRVARCTWREAFSSERKKATRQAPQAVGILAGGAVWLPGGRQGRPWRPGALFVQSAFLSDCFALSAECFERLLWYSAFVLFTTLPTGPLFLASFSARF